MNQEKILTRGFAFSFCAVFCNSFIFYMLISISAEYAQVFGAGGSLSGLASSIFVIGVLIMRILFSHILSRVGWKRMIFIFQPLHVASCFLYFLIVGIKSFILVRFIHGLCFGLASSSVLTSGTYHLPKSRYGEANGYLMTGITLAIAVGPFAAGLVYDTFGATGCFIAAVFIALGMFVFILLSKTDYASVYDAKAAAREAALGSKAASGLNKLIEVSAIPITICVFISAFSYSSVLSFIRTYGAITGYAKTVSAFFIVYAVVLLISRPIAGRLQDRYGDAKILVPCIIVQFISHLLLGVCINPFGIILSAITCAAGYGTATSCMSTITSRDVSASRKSYAVNTYWIGCDLANGLGPVVLGAVMDALGIGNMYIVAAVLSLVMIPIYLFICKKKS